MSFVYINNKIFFLRFINFPLKSELHRKKERHRDLPSFFNSQVCYLVKEAISLRLFQDPQLGSRPEAKHPRLEPESTGDARTTVCGFPCYATVPLTPAATPLKNILMRKTAFFKWDCGAINCHHTFIQLIIVTPWYLM